MKTVTIYTDGACSGNPGPGGWGAILQYGKAEKELSGSEPSTTNNRMELLGVITALETLKEPCLVDLYSDSVPLHTAHTLLLLPVPFLSLYSDRYRFRLLLLPPVLQPKYEYQYLSFSRSSSDSD